MSPPDTTYRLFGIPVTVTNKLKAGKADPRRHVPGRRRPRPRARRVMLLAERYAEYDEQAIRVVTRYDLGLLHPEGVIVLTDA